MDQRGRGTVKLTIFAALALAFAGGVILNLMPCVFPVLFLKALALVSSGAEEKRKLRAQGAAYTLGILVSFWIVVALLLVLKAGGAQLGWGFQLQSPWFVAVMCVGLFVLALSLLGFFEIGLRVTSVGGGLAAKQGLAGSFWTGVLATVVATPCTAPLMGAAVGYALAQRAATAFAVFTAVALGLAAPYLLLTLQPAWTRMLPRPGAWMDVLKKLTAIPLLLTVVWLGWVFVHLETRTVATVNGWAAYTDAALDTARSEHRPVFVDFTADWCLSCKYNEAAVLRSTDVQVALRDDRYVLLRADWTKYDPKITAALAAVGRSGVPTYVVYPADGSAPVVLPELLTKSVVLDAVRNAAH
jgi:thiol:disulfide interchange protein DsbD